MSALSRRSLVASAAALPAITLPAFADAATDPIFAAIEKHRIVYAETIAAILHESDVDADDEASEQEIAAANEAYHAAFSADIAAALDLINIEPTTIGGAVALLKYYVEAEAADFQGFPIGLSDKNGETVFTDTSEGDLAFGHFLARNVVRALSKISAGA